MNWNPGLFLILVILTRRTFTGAWIETEYGDKEARPHYVAPSRVRELKPQIRHRRVKKMKVAPSRVRELKLLSQHVDYNHNYVAPSRVRELKRRCGVDNYIFYRVAPSRVRELKLTNITKTR